MRRSQVQLHQVLCGYDNGHQVIAASQSLPPTAERRVLALSDLSGPSLVEGFESYLTGYPLPEIQSFVFAKTWYASEMKRPGCVWTHSLLIRFEDLPQIPDLAPLTELFRRPTVEPNQRDYQRPVLADARPPRQSDLQNVLAVQGVARIAKSFLEQEERPTVIRAPSTTEFEHVVLRLWSNLWPRLRRQTSFCTGSISLRELGTGYLDLQVIPMEAVLPSAFGKSQSVKTKPLPEIPEMWFVIPPPDLQNFLWTYGADIPDGRQSYVRLADVFRCLVDGRASPDTVLSSITANFPHPESARFLKKSLVDPEGSDRPGATDPWELLARLGHHGAYPAFAGVVDVNDVAQKAWRQSSAAWQLIHELVDVELNTWGEALLRALLSAAPSSALISYAESQPDVVAEIIADQPALYGQTLVWKSRPELRETFFHAIAHRKHIASDGVAKLSEALVRAGASEVALPFVQRFRAAAIDGVMAALNTSAYDRTEGAAWVRAITETPSDLVDVLGRLKRIEPRLADDLILELRRDAASQVNWAQLLRAFTPKDWAWLSPEAKARLLRMSFSLPAPDGPRLAAPCFDDVLQSLRKSRLRASAWYALEAALPPTPWYRRANRERRLFEGLASAAVRLQWPLDDLFAELAPATENQLKGLLRETDAGNKLLSKAAHNT